MAVGVSGGKDSHAVAWALSRFLKDYEGPKLFIHSDLGSVEWLDSHPACQRIADRIGWELITCERKAGGMMARWEGRWDYVEFYEEGNEIPVEPPTEWDDLSQQNDQVGTRASARCRPTPCSESSDPSDPVK